MVRLEIGVVGRNQPLAPEVSTPARFPSTSPVSGSHVAMSPSSPVQEGVPAPMQ